MSAALANGVAIFATEWGTCDASGDGTLDLAEKMHPAHTEKYHAHIQSNTFGIPHRTLNVGGNFSFVMFMDFGKIHIFYCIPQ